MGMRKELIDFIEVIHNNQPLNFHFKHIEFNDEGHMSSPLLSNYQGLKYIFRDLKFSESFEANYSDEEFLKKENEIAIKYGESAKRAGESYYNLGASIYQKNLPGAITVFKRSVEVYPYDINLISTLAALYVQNNEIPKAIDTYKYAIKVSKSQHYGNGDQFRKEIERLNNY